MRKSHELDIGEVARKSGLPASTLRFYEEKGLVSSTGRNGLRRVFSSDVLEKLALISLARSAGFSLNEISEILAEKEFPILRRVHMEKKAEQLEVQIAKLSAMRDGLRHAAKCSAPSHMECPTFQRLLQNAITRNKTNRTNIKSDGAPAGT